MHCTRTDKDGETHLRLQGALDAQTASEVRTIFDAVVAAKPRRVIVDLAALTLLDSSGVGLLVALCKRVRADGGDVGLVGAVEQPLMVIRLLKLEELFGLDGG
jgi:anti-sigma B factor antagonist